MTTKLQTKKNGEITESLTSITRRIRRNIAAMDKAVERFTLDKRIEIGRDLARAKKLIDRDQPGEWQVYLEQNFAWSLRTAHRCISAWKSRKEIVDRRFETATDFERSRNPNAALPRQKVKELPIREIVDDIDDRVFAERAKNERKESKLQKSMALELIDAGFRALSHKLHADKGGNDDAMRRLSDVRKALKTMVNDGGLATYL